MEFGIPLKFKNVNCCFGESHFVDRPFLYLYCPIVLKMVDIRKLFALYPNMDKMKLYLLYRSFERRKRKKSPKLSRVLLNEQFELDWYGDNAYELFRFSVPALRNLIEHLNLPERMRTSYGCRFDREFGICLVLRRLCYPNRYFTHIILLTSL